MKLHHWIILSISLTIITGLKRIAFADSSSTVSISSLSFSSTVTNVSTTALSNVPLIAPPPLHAIHLTAWVAGSTKYRRYLDELFQKTTINAVIIDIKEYEGEVYIPGVKQAEEAGAYTPAVPDLGEWVAALKKKGIYTVARIVVFKDNKMPRKKSALAIHTADGNVWHDRHGITWLDPHNRDAWKYNLLIALQASKIGFDEVQFDYIRFPTDGNLKLIRYKTNKETLPETLVGFLEQAHQLLHPLGTKISIDVFGLTTTVKTGMGIGQLMTPMAQQVDYVCPMIYPSHYAPGEYGIPNPNKEPYKIIHHAIHDALIMLGPSQTTKLRPYLQDFTLFHVHYGRKEVEDQMRATHELGVDNWTLWNASCKYTVSALEKPVSPALPISSTTTTAAHSSVN